MFTNDNSEMNLQNRKVVKNNYCKVIVKPTKEELELHTDFLKKELKKNYY